MKKQVLIFGHGYNPPFIDVYNQYTQIFAPEQYETTVVYLTGEPDEQVKQRTLATNVYFLNPARSSVRNLKLTTIKQMIQLCREKKFAIVICHRYKPTYIMTLVGYFTAIPRFFAVMHELGTLRRFTRRLFVYLFARNKIILAGVSNAVRSNILTAAKWLDPNKVVVLPNAIDIKTIEQQLMTASVARQLIGVMPTDFIFGNIGRLVKNKNQTSLIAAFAKITSACPTAKLVIVGSGKLQTELEQQVATLNLQQRVIFTGFVADAFKLAPAFDIYVSSATQEAFGRVLLEAMIAKVPIIATRTDGVPDVVGDAGVLVAKNDVDLLADEMLKAYQLTPAERSVWRDKSYQQVVTHFSLERFAEIFWQQYSHLQ